METPFYLLNFGISVASLMISLFGLVLARVVPYSGKVFKKYLLLIFTLLTAYSVSNLVSWIVTEKPGYSYMMISYVSLFCGSLFSSMLPPLLTMFLLFCAGKSRKNPATYIAITLWLIYLALLIITQFTDWIYYYTPDNTYYRGPYYFVLLVPLALLMAFNLLLLVRVRKSLSPQQKLGFLVFMSVPLICMLVQMLFYGVLMTLLSSVVSAMVLLMQLLFDQLDRYLMRTREAANLRANTLILQMRPHFIYNTMTSIYCMIDQKPQTAKEVTERFTDYLRNNFSAIAQDKPIPFVKEFEHTKAYLAVEQARFEGQLFFESDTPFINFRLPALTLQPIVENAVKHGLDPELNPLHISVFTREVEKGAEVSVLDTGPGFGEIDNDEPHIALVNIRERLEMMCKGTLTITPRKEGGTKVTIFIPMKKKKINGKI